MTHALRAIGFILVTFAVITIWSSTGRADVTGSFGLGFSFSPIQCQDLEPVHGIVGFPDQPCEKTFFKIDFETNLNINVTISGLTIGLHSHAGVTGFEDILLSFQTSLGMVDITDLFVFAQPYGVWPSCVDDDGDGQCNEDPIDGIDNDNDGKIDEDPVEFISTPVCYEDAPGSGVCLTLFVKKRVNTSVNLGGLIFSNLAVFEDINFPVPGFLKPNGAIYTQQSQSFGFGDLMTISGQTPSGISVTGQTGLCIESGVDQIKKHGFPYTVNPDCVGNETVVKPPVLFDFEKLAITGIPLAANVTMNAFVECNVQDDLLCKFVNTFTLTGGPIFDVIRVTTTFEDLPLGPDGATLSNITVVSSGDPYLISLVFDPDTFTIVNLVFIANFTLNPESNPASLQIIASGSPGITSFSTRLTVQRSGLTFFVLTNFDANPASHTFSFANLRLGLRAAAGVVSVAANAVVDDTGTIPEGALLMGGDLTLTVAF